MSKKNEILVVEASPAGVRVCLARRSGKRVEFIDACSFLTSETFEEGTALQDQNLVDGMCSTLVKRGWTGMDAVCVLSGPAVSCQCLDMPPIKGAALDAAVKLKIGQQLHFPVSEAILKTQPLPAEGGDEANSRVIVTIARKTATQVAVDAAARARLNLVAVAAAPAALARLAKETTEAGGMRAVLHFGDRGSTLVVFNEGRASVIAEIPQGMEEFVAALRRPIINGDDVINLDDSQAIAIRDEVGIPAPDQKIESINVTGGRLLPLFEPMLQKLTRQLTQWMAYAATTENGKKVERFTLVGPGGKMPGLDEAIAKRMKVDVTAATWLESVADVSGPAQSVTHTDFGVAAGAVLHTHELADLTPPAVLKERKVRRVRRSTSRVCPFVAAAILGLAFLFDHVGTKIQPAVGAQQDRLSELQALSSANADLQRKRDRVDELQSRFDTFSAATPNWQGLFKELSRLLPSEVQISELRARSEPSSLSVVLEANVYEAPGGRHFEEVVEQTLLALERSPFFKRVAPLSSSTQTNRSEQHREAGSLAVSLELAYNRPPTEAK